MQGYGKVQEELKQNDIIDILHCELTTIMRIGGYNAKPYSPSLNLYEQLRPQSIKGVWRWWARALVAGALIELNCQLPKTIGELTKRYIAPLLGSIEYPSKVGMIVNIKDSHPSLIKNKQDPYLNIPRIRLITLSREQNTEAYYSQINWELNLIKWVKELPEEDKNFALSSLILSLILGGIGSCTTRGFGKMKVSVKRHDVLASILNKLQNQADKVRSLKELIRQSLIYTKDYIDRYKDKGREVWEEKLPPYPALTFYNNFFKLGQQFSFNDPITALRCISKATLKASWKRYIRERGANYHTWILGLPRKGKSTGYLSLLFDRRASAINFTILKDGHKWIVIPFSFISNDWVELLKSPLWYKAKGMKDQRVYELIQEQYQGLFNEKDAVQKILDIAWEFVKRVIKECVSKR